MSVEKPWFLLLSHNDGPNPSPEVGIGILKIDPTSLSTELEVAAPAFEVEVGFFKASLQRLTPISWSQFPNSVK